MFFRKKKLAPIVPAAFEGVPFIATRSANSEIKAYIRRDLSDRWEEVNPVLQDGELGYAIDTRYIAVGDGVSKWAELYKAVLK